jgi:hypothetical protein
MLGLVVSTGALTTISVRTAHADECISKPYANAPQGYHWYYYTVDDHRCWILRGVEDAALVSNVTHQDVQDVESDQPTVAPDTRRLPPAQTKPIVTKSATRAPARASEHHAAKPTRSRFPAATDTAAASSTDAVLKTTSVPAAAFIVRWPSDFSPSATNVMTQTLPVMTTQGAMMQSAMVQSAQDTRPVEDTAKPAAQNQPIRQNEAVRSGFTNATQNSPLLATTPITAGILTLEPLTSFLNLRSEHSVAIITAALSFLTIAAGISVAARRSHRRREIEYRRTHWSADAQFHGTDGLSTPRPVRVLDSPPMFHEPTSPERTARNKFAPQTSGRDAPVRNVFAARGASARRAPVRDASIRDASVQDAPVEDTSVRSAPAEEASVQAASAQNTPVRDASVQDASARQTSARDASARDTSARDTSARDTSAREASDRFASTHAFENTLHKLLHELETRRPARVAASGAATWSAGARERAAARAVSDELDRWGGLRRV